MDPNQSEDIRISSWRLGVEWLCFLDQQSGHLVSRGFHMLDTAKRKSEGDRSASWWWDGQVTLESRIPSWHGNFLREARDKALLVESDQNETQGAAFSSNPNCRACRTFTQARGAGTRKNMSPKAELQTRAGLHPLCISPLNSGPQRTIKPTNLLAVS